MTAPIPALSVTFTPEATVTREDDGAWTLTVDWSQSLAHAERFDGQQIEELGEEDAETAEAARVLDEYLAANGGPRTTVRLAP